MAVDQWAKGEAERLLGAMDDRWRHVEAVARLADRASGVVEARPIVRCSPPPHGCTMSATLPRCTGLACKLSTVRSLDREQGQERIAGLVAYDSGAEHEAKLLGLGEELGAFTGERSAVTDALWYCDLTTGPDGERMTLEERLAEVEGRHGRDAVIARAMREGWEELEACVERVERRLRAAETISR